MSETARGKESLLVQGSAEGKRSEGMNPMSGTGPRGREALEGVNRQEGGKPCRWNEPGVEARAS
jgi:hypothetical protein